MLYRFLPVKSDRLFAGSNDVGRAQRNELRTFDFTPILCSMMNLRRALLIAALFASLRGPAAVAEPSIAPSRRSSNTSATHQSGTKALQDMLTTQKAHSTIDALPPVAERPASFDSVEQQGTVVGSVTAPTSVDVFFDFSSGGSRVFFDELLPQIIERFIRPRRATLIFHELGLGAQAADPLAGEALRCAGEHQKYLQFARQLVGNQGGVSVEKFTQCAEAVGLNQFEFSRCLNSRRHRAAVTKDRQQSLQRGVRALPGFSINGRSPVGVRTIGEFERAIAAAHS